VLVDTSVWVDHLRSRKAALAEALERGDVWCHPFVIGELACGNIANRAEVLSLLAALPQAELAENAEVLAFVEAHRLMGRGIGWVDAHLLASARLSRQQLWTLDRRLAAVAASLDPAER
jgi:predicted nucleic acid-binding protein